MALTHHTGIPKLQWKGTYPPCTPSAVITASLNPFCPGDSITITPELLCIETVEIASYAWMINGITVSTSSDPYTTDAFMDGNVVQFGFMDNLGQSYFSNQIVMVEQTTGCPEIVNYGLLYNLPAITSICVEVGTTQSSLLVIFLSSVTAGKL